MLDILMALHGTSVPALLMGLGGLLLLLSFIERRVAAAIGFLFLCLGVGILVAPHVARSPDEFAPRTAVSAPAEPAPQGPASADAQPVDAVAPASAIDLRTDGANDTMESAIARAVGPGGEATGCTTRFTDLELDPGPVAGKVATSGWNGEPAYGGFLGNLMPSVRLLPCATRRFISRPLTLRSVALGSGRPEATARRVLTEGGFDGLERTYGSQCTRSIGEGEIPLARVRVLRFDTVEAAQEWEALPWDADADAVTVSEGASRRTAWFKRSCGDAPAAVFWQEGRAGNVSVAITIYTSPDSLEDRSVANYARALADDMVGDIMPQGTTDPSAGGSRF